MQSYFAWNLYGFLDEQPTFIDVLDSVAWLVWRLSSFVIHAESQKTSKSARSLKVIYFFRSGIRWRTEGTTRWLNNREVILSSTFTVVWFDFTVMNDDNYNKYGLLTKCEVKMSGYWPRSFFVCFMDRDGSSRGP